MIDASDVFNPRDFESISLKVYFSNLTTRTEVKNTNKTSLVELGDKSLVLELPERSCNEKHNVMVKIVRIEKQKEPSKKDSGKKNKNEREVLSITGKVRSLEDVGQQALRVEIDCLQYDEKGWQEIVSLFEARQAEIENFLTAVRGF
jgi:hypothetical protein